MSYQTVLSGLSPTVSWSLGDSASPAVSAPTGHNGTAAAGTITFATTGMLAGDPGTCVAFGSNTAEVLNVPANSLFDIGSGDYTYVVWVKSATPHGLIVLFGADQPSVAWYFNITSSKLGQTLGATAYVSTNANVDDGNLHMVAFTRVSGVVHNYVDGVEDGTGTSIPGAIGDATNPVGIGNFPSAGGSNAFSYASGNMQWASWWKGTALNSTQLGDLYTAGTNAGGATTVTQTGSLSGRNGMYNVITVAANGSLASPVTVTVAVTAGAATLNGKSLTTVNLTLPAVAAPATSFMVQSPSAGNSTLHFTNNGGLSNPGDQTYASAAGVIVVTNANFFFSPGTWGDGVASLGANNIPTDSNLAALMNNGSYIDCTVASTTNLKLAIDIIRMDLAGDDPSLYPQVLYTTYDGSNWSAFTLSQLTVGQTSVDFISGAGSGTYRVKCWIKGHNATGGDQWTGSGLPSIPENAVVVRGMIVDSGATASTYTPKNKKGLFQGDSIVAAIRAINSGDGPGAQDAVRGHFVPIISEAIGAEYDQCGFGNQGYETTGSGNVPDIFGSYNKYFSGKTKTLSVYDEIYCFLGTNGTTLQADVATLITDYRAAAPSAYIFICVPPGGYAKTNILAAVAAAADSKVACLGSTFDTTGLTQNGTASFASPDGLHPYYYTNPRYAAAIIEDRKAFFMPAVGDVKSGVVYDGGSKTGSYSAGGGGSNSGSRLRGRPL